MHQLNCGSFPRIMRRKPESGGWQRDASRPGWTRQHYRQRRCPDPRDRHLPPDGRTDNAASQARYSTCLLHEAGMRERTTASQGGGHICASRSSDRRLDSTRAIASAFSESPASIHRAAPRLGQICAICRSQRVTQKMRSITDRQRPC
jgi:hypothetical protein